ncbi:MAG: hypothetical protein A2096_02110 [Spirochaetes bacterium GWF1_41_5]|nr:MAG: hypothetical protein A2096_02110 [Spirochaetes bacterium GWF1_41_5]
MKKIFFIFMVTALIAGCAKKKDSSKIIISYGTIEVLPENIAANIRIIKKFEKIHPNVRVTLKNYNKIDQLLTHLAAGNAPDIIWMHPFWMPKYVESGVALDLSPYLEASFVNTFYKVCVDAYTYNNKIYGLPIQANFPVLYYNKDLLEKTSLPCPNLETDINTLVNFTKKITIYDKKNPNNSIIGFYNFTPLHAFNIGGFKLFSKDGDKLYIQNSKFRELLKLAYDINQTYKLTSSALSMDQNVNAIGGGDSENFLMGKTAFIIDSPYIVRTLKKARFTWGLTLLPKDTKGKRQSTQVETICNFVNANSKQKEAAVKFLKFYTSSKGLIEQAKVPNGIPPLTELLKNDLIPKYYGKKETDLFNLALVNGTYLPPFKDLIQFWQTIYNPFLKQTICNTKTSFNDILSEFNKSVRTQFPEMEIK